MEDARMNDREVATLLVGIYLAAHVNLFLAHAQSPRDVTVQIQSAPPPTVLVAEPWQSLVETSATAAVSPIVPWLGR
jgi:hypothetical protein